MLIPIFPTGSSKVNVMAKAKTKGSLDAQLVLFGYFKFKESDLAANRLGVFSDKQKRELRVDKKDSKRSSILVGLLFIGIGLVILFLLIGLPLLQGARLDWVEVSNLLSSILVPVAFLGIGIYSLYGGLKTSTDILEHSIGSVTGPVRIVEAERATYRSPYRRRILYELRIGAKEFNAYPELPDAMTQGHVYTIYFDNADDEILSVEWVSKSEL
jgi:hypothetical protein